VDIPIQRLTWRPTWKDLAVHQKPIKKLHLRKLFANVYEYEPNTWEPTIVEQMVTPQCGRHDPVILKQEAK